MQLDIGGCNAPWGFLRALAGFGGQFAEEFGHFAIREGEIAEFGDVLRGTLSDRHLGRTEKLAKRAVGVLLDEIEKHVIPKSSKTHMLNAIAAMRSSGGGGTVCHSGVVLSISGRRDVKIQIGRELGKNGARVTKLLVYIEWPRIAYHRRSELCFTPSRFWLYMLLSILSFYEDDRFRLLLIYFIFLWEV